MHRAAFTLLLVLFSLACSRPHATPATTEAAPKEAHSTAPPVASAPPPPPKLGTPRYLDDAALEWAFWTSDGKLVAASKTDLWLLAAPSPPQAHVAAPIESLVARNGSDRFVVLAPDGTFTLWDALTLKPVGPIDHPARGRGGAVARDGSLVALGGCKEIAADKSLVTSCGELYDGKTGRHLASFTGKHDFDDLGFSDDGKYLVARAQDTGLTVFDAATGKMVVTRPWKRLLEVHAWNRSDLGEVIGSKLVVSHGDAVEVVDLATGKSSAKTTQPGRTLAVLGEKTMRVAILQGEAGRVRVWDPTTNAIVRTFDLAKHITTGANCAHCALEIDETDEDRVWMTSAYTNDRLALHIGTGAIEKVEAHDLRSDSVPSPTHRVEEWYDYRTRVTRCVLDRRDRDEPGKTQPTEYCDRTYGPSHRSHEEWPYPGFDPKGRRLASIDRHELRVLDVDQLATVCVMGKSGGSSVP